MLKCECNQVPAYAISTYYVFNDQSDRLLKKYTLEKLKLNFELTNRMLIISLIALTIENGKEFCLRMRLKFYVSLPRSGTKNNHWNGSSDVSIMQSFFSLDSKLIEKLSECFLSLEKNWYENFDFVLILSKHSERPGLFLSTKINYYKISSEWILIFETMSHKQLREKRV